MIKGDYIGAAAVLGNQFYITEKLSPISKFFMNSPPVVLQSVCFDGKMKAEERGIS